ncbi:hypothetical protein OAK97_01535 [bacterium]|nr:hypothetical protein [bacterium]
MRKLHAGDSKTSIDKTAFWIRNFFVTLEAYHGRSPLSYSLKGGDCLNRIGNGFRWNSGSRRGEGSQGQLTTRP